MCSPSADHDANVSSMRLRPSLLVALSLAVAACGDDEPCDGEACGDASVSDARGESDAAAPDLSFPDAEPIDTGPPDLGTPDVGFALKEASCAACDVCSLCVNAGSERYCADACDVDLDGCLFGFSCIDIDPDMQGELFTCIPPGGFCSLAGVGFGTPCFGDLSLCYPERTFCQGDVLGMGYCTDGCDSDLSCPQAYRCATGDDGSSVCLARFASDAERCGRESREDEVTCAWDGDCPAGARCAGAWPGFPGVCSAPCGLDGACGDGHVCLGLAGGPPVCIAERCACRGEYSPTIDEPRGLGDLFGDALVAVELDRCHAIYTVAEMVSNPPDMLHDPYRLEFYDAVHNEPWRAPIWARGAVRSVDREAFSTPASVYQVAGVIEAAAVLAERPAVAQVPDPFDPTEPLFDAVVRFIESAGGTPDRAAIADDVADVPPDLQLAMAYVIEGARQALVARNAGFSALSAASIEQLYQYGPAFVAQRGDGFGLNPTSPDVQRLLNRDLDYGQLYGGAAAFFRELVPAGLESFAVPSTGTATVATTAASFLFLQDTPVGKIGIAGGANHVYDERTPGLEGAWAVLVDLGGDDVYRIAAGGNVTARNAVSVLIDLGGDDRYGYVEVPDVFDTAPRLPSDSGGRFHPQRPEQGTPISLSQTPRQGGARCGFAALVDLGSGRDEYRSLRMSQGSGLFGIGVLVDEGGNDTYEAEIVAQGAAAFGIGIAYDLAGDDQRRAYSESQAFAFARAIGLLYDLGGNDRYTLDVGDPAFGGDPLYPSAQRPAASNASLGQGFAFGRRADFSDRAFMSAGIGMLVDHFGDDRYEGSVFAQGGGFWFGTGILADYFGSDHYDAIWYGMASGAHYSLGMLLDGEGDDTYGGTLPRVNVTLAGGHDFSVAFLVDEAGNDIYNGSRITLGSGNASGMGFFIDNRGDDSYSAMSPFSFGSAGLRDAELSMPGSARRKIDTIGVFIDAGGTDVYEQAGMAPEDARDGASWLRGQSTDPVVRSTEKGTAIDGSGESTIHFHF
jgi:hypothetical protein